MHVLTHKNLPSASKLGVGPTYLTAPKSLLASPKYSLRVEKSKQLRAPGDPTIHPNTFLEGTCFQLVFPGGASGKEPACQLQETQVRSLGQEDPLETVMAPHSSILAWRISWTEESGGLQPMGSWSWT